MNGKIFQSFYLITFVLMSGVVSAQNYLIQKDHSQIFFNLTYLRFGEVQGQFKHFEGSLELGDKQEIKNLLVTLQVDSIDTGHRQRDGHLRAQDFFYVQKYPKSQFRYLRTLSCQGSRYKIEGLLTIKETTKTQILEIDFSQEETDSWGYLSRFVKFSGELNRLDFGLDWNKTLEGESFLVGEKVRLHGVIQLQQKKSLTPTSKHMIPDTPIMRLREKSQRGETKAQSTLDKTTEVNPPEIVHAPPETLEKTLSKPSELISEKKSSRPVNQNPWFWLLGLMGFFASLILGLYFKKWLIEHDSAYEEDSLKGHVSDLFTIGFTLLFAVAFWFVGWGT